jgi:hypothetical protein
MSNWRFIVNGAAVDPETDTTYSFILEQWVGAGMANIQNISSNFGLLDGDIFQRQRADVTSLTITGTVNGSSIADLHTKRRNLINAVKPDRSASQEAFVVQYLGSGSTRQASTYYEAGLSLGEVDVFRERIGLRLAMFDPFWEAPTSSSATLTTQATFSSCRLAQRAACGQWGSIGGGGTNGAVTTIISGSDGTLYVAGGFGDVAGVSCSSVAQWNGTAWSKVGNAVASSIGVNTMVLSPTGILYIGGDFTTASGTTACRVAQWTGTQWTNVGNAMNAGVSKLIIGPDGHLYAGGDFTVASATTACRVAKWTGTAWTNVGNAFGPAGAGVAGLAFDSASTLYATGDFTTASNATITTRQIAKYSGTGWTEVGSGAAGGIGGLDVVAGNDGTIYAGGQFSSVNGDSNIKYLAAWNGTNWSRLGSGVDNVVYKVIPRKGGGIYATGQFLTAGGIPSYTAAAWNGTTWLPFDVNFGAATVRAIHSASDSSVITVGHDLAATASAAAVTSITNNGTAATYPVFTASAPTSSSARLYQLINYTSGETIYFNLGLLAGEVVTLDLRPGKKTFTSSFRGNLISTILPGSNVSTWRLLPGANNVSTWLSGGSGAAKLSWVERYWSAD